MDVVGERCKVSSIRRHIILKNVANSGQLFLTYSGSECVLKKTSSFRWSKIISGFQTLNAFISEVGIFVSEGSTFARSLIELKGIVQ